MTGIRNDGVHINAGGPVNISCSAIGTEATVGPRAQEQGQPSGDHWDIGVITVLSEEAHAVRRMMRSAGRYRTLDQPGGRRFDEMVLDAADVRVKIAGLQSLDPTALNFRDLRLFSGDLTGRW